MTEKEKHDYFGFDRFLQVMGTKYEVELLELEKQYYDKKIDDELFEFLWGRLIEKMKEDEE